jgi:hypothetical protein
MKKKLFAAVAIALLAGSPALAGKAKDLNDNAAKLQPGQTESDVVKIMGEPGNREFSGNQTAWQYCARSSLTHNSFVVIYLQDGKVQRLATYTKPWLGGCASQYEPAKWVSEKQPG